MTEMLTDLGAVISRYVDVTEENLERAIDEVEEARAILLDEADALFGRRSGMSRRRQISCVASVLIATAVLVLVGVRMRRRRLSGAKSDQPPKPRTEVMT
jgi:hypothetical protein